MLDLTARRGERLAGLIGEDPGARREIGHRGPLADRRVVRACYPHPAVLPEIGVRQVAEEAVRDEHRVRGTQPGGGILDDGRTVQHKTEAHPGRLLSGKPTDVSPDGREGIVRPVDGELACRKLRIPRRLTLEHSPGGFERRGGVVRESDGKRGQLVGVPAAGENRIVEVRTQSRERGAEGWLAEMQSLGCPGDAALGKQRVQRHEQVQVEARE
ncbi:hypothetical protein DC31_16525 [Microbacterium sp. CH12i]|nr:hypothetical protein DC31_16525 [Microbacterium sp. CH12i]